jgi:hypothetical protein
MWKYASIFHFGGSEKASEDYLLMRTMIPLTYILQKYYNEHCSIIKINIAESIYIYLPYIIRYSRMLGMYF